MKVTKTLDVKDRVQWRKWLEEHYASEPEIWLVFYKKNSGKPRLPYNDAVEEALCFGWIDSTVKLNDDVSFVQRFSPRRKNSGLSEMNKERVRRLIKTGKMTEAGLESIIHHLDNRNNLKSSPAPKKYVLPKDILAEIKKNKEAWKNFQKFPESYKRIRIGWIDGSRNRPDFFKTRLNYFIKMTAKNKRFGMVQ